MPIKIHLLANPNAPIRGQINLKENIIMTTLRDKACLAKLKFTEFGNKKNDKALALRLAAMVGGESDSFETKKNRIACPAIRQLEQLKNNCRTNSFNRLTAAYDTGERFLSGKLADKLEKEFLEFKDQHNELKAELKLQVEDGIDSARRRLGTAFDASDYPSLEAVVGSYTMNLSYRLIPDKEDFRIDGFTDDRQAEIKREMDAEVNDRIEGAVQSVRDRIIESVSHLGEIASGYGENDQGKVVGRFKDTTVTKVADLAAILDDLNVTDCPKIAQASKDLKSKLSNITSDGIKASLGERERVAKEAKSIVNNLGGLYA